LLSVFDGTAWGPPKVVPVVPQSGDALDVFLPSLAARSSNGLRELVVTFFHFGREDCNSDCDLIAGVVRSSDGGTSWTPYGRLTFDPMPLAWLPITQSARAAPHGGYFLGDYTAVVFLGPDADRCLGTLCATAMAVFPIAEAPTAPGPHGFRQNIHVVPILSEVP
jgi:hypothetical protein